MRICPLRNILGHIFIKFLFTTENVYLQINWFHFQTTFIWDLTLCYVTGNDIVWSGTACMSYWIWLMGAKSILQIVFKPREWLPKTWAMFLNAMWFVARHVDTRQRSHGHYIRKSHAIINNKSYANSNNRSHSIFNNMVACDFLIAGDVYSLSSYQNFTKVLSISNCDKNFI